MRLRYISIITALLMVTFLLASCKINAPTADDPLCKAGEGVQCIAFYLPQFHPIPENDAAWGTGFTEWTSVKRARPLAENHVQPKVPLNGRYYDLRDSHSR